MPRYAPTTNPRDTSPEIEGDDAFSGVNAKLPPELLTQGMVSGAVNMRFRRGRAATREGMITPVYHRWTADTGPHTVLGSGIYSDPAGVEWLLLVTPNKVMQLRAGFSSRTILLPEPLTAPCTVVQAFNHVLLFRNAETAPAALDLDIMPWVWDGGIRSAFVPVGQQQTFDNTVPIPNGPNTRGLQPVLMNNRLLVPYGRDRIAVSDVLNYTRYDEALNDFNVNDGSEAALTAIFPFTNNTVLVLKDKSTYQISGVYGDLSQARLDVINPQVGCIAGRTVQMVGGDVFWLSARGVFRLEQIIQARLQTAAIAVSDPIFPITERINRSAASGAVAAVAGEYYYLAVPLDDSRVNNAILPYNSVTGSWEGVHVFPAGVQLDALHVADYFDRKELYAIDYASGLVHLMYYANNFERGSRGDRVGETPTEIASSITTRGYRLGTNGFVNFRRTQLAIETSRPALTVSAQTEAVSDAHALRTISKSRTRSYRFGIAPYLTTNANDDHTAPGREDYSIVPPFQARSGVRPDFVQASTERLAVRKRGRFLQLTLANTAGYAALSAVQLEGDETERGQRTQN